MTNKQVIHDCQQGNQGLSPQDAMRDSVARALMLAHGIDPDRRHLTDEYPKLADAAIAAVYAALLEMELQEEAAEAGATAITSASLGMSAHRLVAREFRAVIRAQPAVKSTQNVQEAAKASFPPFPSHAPQKVYSRHGGAR